MRDLALDLHTATQKPPARQPGTRRWLWAACAALAATLAVLAGWLVRPSEQLPRLYLSITPPPGHYIQRRVGEEGGTAISPDGSMLAFIAVGKTGVQQFWVRRMDDGQARPLPGTERGRHPFWSPDSRSLGFFANGKLKRIDVSGGTAQTLCDAPNERGAPGAMRGLSCSARWERAFSACPLVAVRRFRLPVFRPTGSRHTYGQASFPTEGSFYTRVSRGPSNRTESMPLRSMLKARPSGW